MVRFPAAFPVGPEADLCVATASHQGDFQAVEFPLLEPVGSLAALCSRAVIDFVVGVCFVAAPGFEVDCGAGVDYVVADVGHDLAAARQPRYSTHTIKSGLQRLWPRAL